MGNGSGGGWSGGDRPIWVARDVVGSIRIDGANDLAK
jgi:hypothetical protein